MFVLSKSEQRTKGSCRKKHFRLKSSIGLLLAIIECILKGDVDSSSLDGEVFSK